VAERLDQLLEARLKAANVPASPRSSDAAFIRRVTIDLLGRLPTASRVSAFLADKEADKRRKLVDELLANPEFGRYFGAIWYDLLIKEVTHRVGPEVFENWLADRFNANKPWDETVRLILTAEGKIDQNPPVLVWFAHTDGTVGKEQVKIKPNDLLGVVAQKFLGQRLQCAECHNHPFTSFAQEQFWASAALVSKVNFRDSDRNSLRKDRAIPSMTSVVLTDKLSITIPEINKTVPARFPDGTPVPAKLAPREAFAKWLTAGKHPTFAPALANRLWGHFLGRGFVNPVDDFRSDNPPSHPDALKLLADTFVSTGFDFKQLVRCICLTNAYQRSSDVLPGNAKDDTLFSHAAVRQLPPNVLFHALVGAIGKDGTRHTLPVSYTNNDRKPESAFTQRFKGDDDEEPELAEYGHGVPQVLWLMNHAPFDGGATVQQALKLNANAGLDHLWLTALARTPTAEERKKLTAFVARESSPAKAYPLLYWAVLNSSEFLFNH
jgi:hypothetical protein